MELFSQSVRDAHADIALSYSPGGGNTPEDGEWVADNRMCSMYRVVTDFHGGWYGWGGLQQAIFIAGNFSASGLLGDNETWPLLTHRYPLHAHALRRDSLRWRDNRPRGRIWI